MRKYPRGVHTVIGIEMSHMNETEIGTDIGIANVTGKITADVIGTRTDIAPVTGIAIHTGIMTAIGAIIRPITGIATIPNIAITDHIAAISG